MHQQWPIRVLLRPHSIPLVYVVLYVYVRLFKSNQRRTNSPTDERDTTTMVDETRDDGPQDYVPCRHVLDSKWDEVWNELIEPKLTQLTGLVFVNPSFARTYYVPTSPFRYDYDGLVEYNLFNNEILASMRSARYENVMQGQIRNDSCFISMHVCSAVQLVDKLCSRCQNLVRLNFHFYYLDDNFMAYIIRYLPNVISINLENSIGLSPIACANLGSLSHLAHLNLTGCDISEGSMSKVLESCGQIESLNVSDNCAITGQCFTSRTIKKLKRLNIRDCWGINSSQLTEMAQNGLSNLIELLCNSGITNDSLATICSNCPSLLHLDISFEEFTYNDDSGCNLLNDKGFSEIAKLTNLKILRLRHIGRLSDKALSAITRACSNLAELTLNLRHRHKLTDNNALKDIAKNCPSLKYFEAVHNHFIGKHSIEELAGLSYSLTHLILRGDELVTDVYISELIKECPYLRTINLDGCKDVGEKTFNACLSHARDVSIDSNGNKLEFQANLVCTAIDRSKLNDMTDMPDNLRIRVSDQRRNKVHYNEFDGQRVNELQLKDTFFPFYWLDFN